MVVHDVACLSAFPKSPCLPPFLPAELIEKQLENQAKTRGISKVCSAAQRNHAGWRRRSSFPSALHGRWPSAAHGALA